MSDLVVEHAPSTYKIPLASDRPRIFNVELASWSENRERTIKRSKAVGEPPFMADLGLDIELGSGVAAAQEHFRTSFHTIHSKAA